MDMESGERPATYSELKAVENRLESGLRRLEDTTGRIARSLVETQEDIRQIRGTMATSMATKGDISQVLSRLDFLMGKDKDNDRTVLVFDHLLKDHEQRIKRLEGRA